MGFWAAVQRATRTGFRVLAGLFMAVVVLLAAYLAWTSWEDRKLARKASETKTWEVTPLPMKLPVVVVLNTRCDNALLNYQMVLEPWFEPGLPVETAKGSSKNPVDLSALLDAAAKVKSDFVQEMARTITEYIVSLTDEEGFQVISFTVPRSALVRVLEEGGKYTSLSAHGSEFCPVATHLRATSANIRWKGSP